MLEVAGKWTKLQLMVIWLLLVGYYLGEGHSCGHLDTMERIRVQITHSDHNVDTQYRIKGNFKCHSSGHLVNKGFATGKLKMFNFYPCISH